MINDLIALLNVQRDFYEMIDNNTYSDGYFSEEDTTLIDGFYDYVTVNIPNFSEIASQSMSNIDNFIASNNQNNNNNNND